jgi:hypothetical protein
MQSSMTRRRAVLALTLAVSASSALVACNFLVDAGSYSVGNSTGSDASADGTSPSDTGTTPVDSSTGDTSTVDTGTLVDSGMSIDTGSLPDEGPPVEGGAVCGQGLPTTSTPFTQLVSACALAVACAPNGFNVNMSDCITEDFLHATVALGCLTSITDCNGFEACMGSRVPTTAQCPATSTAPFCTDGGVAINCGADFYVPIAIDCKVLGGTCAVFDADAGASAGADCKVVSTCSPSDPSTQLCQGNDLYACINGAGYGQNCGANQKCFEDPSSGTSCYYDTGTCTYTGADTYTCNGNDVEWCTSVNSAGAQFPFHCSTAGLQCNSNSDGQGNAGCLAPGCTASDVANCAESCSGSNATVCVGGAAYTFDCKSVGATGTFSTCTMFSDSVGNPYAACQ